MSIKTASLQVHGNLVTTVEKSENVKETGEVVKAHLQHQFLMSTPKGMEIIKVKDLDSKYKDLKENEVCTIDVRVTASSMGQTYYEAV